MSYTDISKKYHTSDVGLKRKLNRSDVYYLHHISLVKVRLTLKNLEN